MIRRARRRGGLVAVLLLAVGACGTPPADPAPVGAAATATPIPAPTPAAATPAASSVSTPPSPRPAGSTAVGLPSARPTPATPTAARPTATPTAASPTAARPSAEQPWVGRFHGEKVVIPRGHGAPVSFTFDDGPSPVYTPQVLALLQKHHAPAVFCVIGTQARAYPALVRKEVKAGHALCNHSHDHDLAMNDKGSAYVRAEITRGSADIAAAAPGVPVPFYRQPGGLWSPRVVRALDGTDLHPLRWSDDPRDWSRPGSKAVVRRVVKRLHPGAVILMHDGGGDRSQTVEAAAFLLPALIDAGWRPVPAPIQRLTKAQAAQPQ